MLGKGHVLKNAKFLFWGCDIILLNNVLEFCSLCFQRIQTFNFYLWVLWNHNGIMGLKILLKQIKIYILMIFFHCKSMSQAKCKMKPKFPVSVHHDLRGFVCWSKLQNIRTPLIHLWLVLALYPALFLHSRVLSDSRSHFLVRLSVRPSVRPSVRWSMHHK